MIPTAFGQYAVIKSLGSGGMADIFLARDPTLDRQVAIKVPHREYFTGEGRARFSREARAAAALEHTAIVPIYDYSEQDGLPYMVMRYLTGGSLEQRLCSGPLHPAEALIIMERIAAALDFAHSRGVIHRDVKSANILFDENGSAYLSDFGIAWMATAGESKRLTSTGMVRGTFDYISPEQAQGVRDLDGRSDLYSLGIVLFEMLTGDVPYRADSAVSLAVQHISAPIPDIRSWRPDLPPVFQAIITRALAKRPEDRYPNGAALMADMRRVVDGLPPVRALAGAPLLRATPRTSGSTRRPGAGQQGSSRNLAWLLAAVALVAVVAAMFALTRPDSTPKVAGGGSERSGAIDVDNVRVTTAVEIQPVIDIDPTSTTAPEITDGEATVTAPTPTVPAVVPVVSIPDEIVFQSNRDGDYEIYIMNIDGSDQRQLTFNQADDNYPRVSPDGRRILFVSERDGNPEIYVMNRDGSEQTRLTNHPAVDSLPTWSPDGRQIAFMSRRDGGTPDYYIMDADDGNVQRVADTPMYEGYVSWSPDGRRLAFSAYPDGSSTLWQIYIANVDGTDIRRITNANYNEWSPVWSPDGEWLLFLSGRDSRGNPGIYVMRPDGSDVRQIYNEPGEEWGTSWSPDGHYILFTTIRSDDVNEIMLINADGGNLRRLTERGSFPSWAVGTSGGVTTTNPPVDAQPRNLERPTEPMALAGDGLMKVTFGGRSHYTAVFAPDQSAVLLSVDMDDGWHIWEADPNGDGLRRQITNGHYNFYQGDYSPDGRTFLTSANLEGDGDIYLIDAATGSVLQQLTNNPGNDYHPRWLPDGSGFIYSADDDGTGNDEIFLATFDGRQRQLTDNEAFDGFATPSADGQWVTFYSGRDGDYEIYVMDINGGNQRRLTTNPGRDASPSFSPDGQWIVFESDRGGRYEIYAVPFAGGQTYRITNASGDTYFPIISPDGRWLMYQSTRGGDMDIYRQPWEPPLP